MMYSTDIRIPSKILCSTVEPLFNGHFGTSKVSLGNEVPFIERPIYTQLHVVGTCVVSIIERLSVVESAVKGGSTVIWSIVVLLQWCLKSVIVKFYSFYSIAFPSWPN